jgi:hypothetical protein
MGSCESVEKQPTIGIKAPSERSCTDIPLCTLFLLSWAGIVVIISYAQNLGADPLKILYGVDYQGNICEDSVATWPDPFYSDVIVCQESCDLTQDGSLYPTPYNSSLYLNWCLPDPSSLVAVPDTFNDAANYASLAMGDLYTSRSAIFLSTLVAVALSYFYLVLARKVGGCMVWAIILLIAAGGGLVTYALFDTAANNTNSLSDDQAYYMQVLGYVFMALTVVYLLIVFALRSRIQLALEVVKEATRALSAMPLLPFFPLVSMLISTLYLAFWMVVCLWIFSATIEEEKEMPADLQPIYGDTYISSSWDTSMQEASAYHFFHLFWNVQFIVYWTFLVCAGATADWYFTPRNETGSDSGKRTMESCVRSTRFHLGTVAFGSLIIAVIQFVRAIVKYIEEKSKAQESKVQRCFFCMIQCCLKCLECCCDKIGKNAFVWTAIYGDSFMPSAASAFSLIWNNLARLAALTAVGDFLLTIGKVIVSLLTTGIVGLVIQNVYAEDLSSIAMPTFAVFILSYLISSLFMVSLDTAIDTIFFCFLVDEKFNKGTGQMLAPPTLLELVDRNAEKSRVRADEMQYGVKSDVGGVTYEKM